MLSVNDTDSYFSIIVNEYYTTIYNNVTLTINDRMLFCASFSSYSIQTKDISCKEDHDI